MDDSNETAGSNGNGTVAERLCPALFVLYGSTCIGALLGGVTESSAAAKVVWMAFPVLPGAAAGFLGLWIGSLFDSVEWAAAVILAGALTLALLWLVDRARTWNRAKGIPVLMAIAAVCGAQGFWLALMMHA